MDCNSLNKIETHMLILIEMNYLKFDEEYFRSLKIPPYKVLNYKRRKNSFLVGKPDRLTTLMVWSG